jgi:glyoxylase-like metal-dependent hydrolase (beta-lactamase superfamily II)
MRDDRIGGTDSEAFALMANGRAVLIDPLPLGYELLRSLGAIDAILLTAANHQRASWRLRRALGSPVLAPAGPSIGRQPGQLEEYPDRRYRDGDVLPGGLRALHAPGPAAATYALWQEPLRALFLSDLLFRGRSPTPRFIDSSYQDDPARTRVSVRELARRLPARVLCFAHGPPILRRGRSALREALRRDPGP